MNKLETEYIHIDENQIDENAIEHAGQILAGGGLVAFPTETVYGLGGNALDASAAKRIYAAKGRPSDNPLIVHISEPEQLDEVAIDIPESARKLSDQFWPGPLTMVLRKAASIPDATTGGLSTVAVRCPSCNIARELIRHSGCPVAAPSANRSGRPSTTRFSHVREDLNGLADLIIDGGDAVIGLESTIVDLTADPPAILRPGFITREQLADVLGDVASEAPSLDDDSSAPKAPGMKYRHYAPNGDLYLVKGQRGDVVRYINKLAKSAEGEGKSIGIIAATDTKERYRYGKVFDIGDRGDDEAIASSLYDTLRQLDTIGADVIYAEYLTNGRIGAAIENRLLKASAYHVLSAPVPMQSSRRKKLLFVEGHGNARSAMAAALFERMYEGSDIDVFSRGIVVQFSEPLNQKTEAVMISNGITVEGFSSVQLDDAEIDQDTILFALEERQRQQLIARFPSANDGNTYLLSAYVGDELEIMDPYGGSLQTYAICFETLRTSIQKMCDRILEEKTYA